MKTIISALLALTLNSGVAFADIEVPAANPQASEALLPKDTSRNEVVIPGDLVVGADDGESYIRSLQFAELTLLSAQEKYYEILRASFVGSRKYSELAGSNQAGQMGLDLGKGVLQIALDAKAAQLWFRGAAPSLVMMKNIIGASRGDMGLMTSIGQKTWSSIVLAAKELKVPKNVISTVALGAFVYVQVETMWVVSMTPAQFDENLRLLDSKIAKLQARRAKIAATYQPISTR